MKFYISKISLWLLDGRRRELVFHPDKVNIITGDSNTGKTDILNIVDYCFFASRSHISESKVNENVDWYGISLKVNEKKYFIGRRRVKGQQVSKEYCFLQSWEVPEELEANTTERAVKKIFESEFSIDSASSIPYGGRSIRTGSKISLRYFLMFNTISANIIESDDGVFIDKQNEDRYREAMPRIFDLAIGLETVEEILKREKRSELEGKIDRLEAKKYLQQRNQDEFTEEQSTLIAKAKEFGIIELGNSNETARLGIRQAISNDAIGSTNNDYDDALEREIFENERRLRSLQRFSDQYSKYKASLKKEAESAKPIEHLKSKDAELIKTSIFEELITSFTEQLVQVRGSVSATTPIDRRLNDEIKELSESIAQKKKELSNTPKAIEGFLNNKEKYVFLGELKAKFDYLDESKLKIDTDFDAEISKLLSLLEDLPQVSTDKKRKLLANQFEEFVTEYMSVVGSALKNYSNYKPVFSYVEKTLSLRQPKKPLVENIGSSSNHMFLQLFFTLAFHDVAFSNSSDFIAPFLIIDQPSRPYYGGREGNADNISDSDEYKIRKAFELLDFYIESRLKSNGHFQFIVFEHVPRSAVDSLKNYHIAGEFFDGVALIPN